MTNLITSLAVKTSATLAHLGYYKKMNLCSRSDIREDDKAVILEQNICRRLFCNDPVRQSLIEERSKKERRRRRTYLQNIQVEDEAILLTGEVTSVLTIKNINWVSAINIQSISVFSILSKIFIGGPHYCQSPAMVMCNKIIGQGNLSSGEILNILIHSKFLS